MTQLTIRRLNQLNQQFYQSVARPFSVTRQKPWDGWETAWNQLARSPKTSSTQPFTVCDVGCGNGRFAAFCHSKLEEQSLRYYGVDSSKALLADARKSLETLLNTQAVCKQTDLIEEMLSQRDWTKDLPSSDLIVCFGVLHHIPSFDLRCQLLDSLTRKLSTHGQLVITCWQFPHNKSLLSRSISPDLIGFSPTELDPNDYFLTWEKGGHAVRYCHWVDQTETLRLTATVGLKVDGFFTADGKSGKENNYFILSR